MLKAAAGKVALVFKSDGRTDWFVKTVYTASGDVEHGTEEKSERRRCQLHDRNLDIVEERLWCRRGMAQEYVRPGGRRVLKKN